MEPENIEFNGIEYEVKGLIQFSSLARLLLDLTKRQQSLENKYESIKESISDKDDRVSDLEIKVFGHSKSNPNKNIIDNKDNDSYSPKSKSPTINNDYIKKPNSFEGENISKSNKEDESKINEEIEDFSNENKVNSDIISKIFKKIKNLEKNLSELNINTKNDMSQKIRSNQDNIKSNRNHIDELDKNYEKINNKLTKFNEDLDKIKVKVEDFNIYDVFKSDSGEGSNVDASKALVMNLENKIFKKFSLYDEKNKKNESDLFKLIEDIKNLKGITDNFKTQNQRTNEKMNELEKNFNEYINKNDNKIEEIINDIESLGRQLKKGFDINELKKEFDTKIKKLEEDLKNHINDKINSNKEIKDASIAPVISQKMNDLEKSIKEIKKNTSDSEKILNYNINNLDNLIKEKISKIEKEMEKKLNSSELNPLNDKIYNLTESSKELNAQIDSLQEYSDKFKSELTNYNKKLEYLNALFIEFKSGMENKKSTNNNDFDLSNFIEQSTFNDYKKENNSKNDKLRMYIDELNRNINDISSTLNRYPTNKDFNQFQSTFMNLFEEFKLSCLKKFMDKQEIHKGLRILENQIKTLAESAKKLDGADNWLIAKKPLNNYQCASCEAMLKDLEQKDNFVAWNKYPNREEKTYRMGHGFSRMLQMVNEEIIKNIENKEGKGYVSDEDKKYSNRSKYNDSSTMPDNKSIKLPKVIQKSLNTDKHGLTVNKFTMSSSPYEEVDSGTPDEPRISKIYKINNHGKKLFGYNKTHTENNNNLSVNNGERKFKIKENNLKSDYLQMNMTQPNEKK